MITKRKNCHCLVLAVFACVLLAGPSTSFAGVLPNCPYQVEPLPDYDALFCRQSGWTGSDAAYTIPLDETRILWLFGDTWVGRIRNNHHVDSTMIRNSLAIQRGRRLGRIKLDFYWRCDDSGKAQAFFKPGDGRGWFWPYHGLVVAGKLYLFFNQTVATKTGGPFGFRHIATWLVQVQNPHDDPTDWRIQQQKPPFGIYTEQGNSFLGSAVLPTAQYIYIYGGKEDWTQGPAGRQAIVARTRPQQILQFSDWQFWDGSCWQKDFQAAAGLFPAAPTEYSVSYLPALGKYVAVYTEMGLSPNILIRFAPAPEGPWSEPCRLYRCPETRWDPNYFCYAAKGHPEISADNELIVTYVCNCFDFWQMARDARIYRPRFLRIVFDSSPK